MAWTMVWHDILDTTTDAGPTVFTRHRVGEIPGNEREFVFRMTSPSTIKFTVPLAHPMGKRISQAPGGFGIVALYQDGVLRMNAEVTSNIINNEGSASTVAINAVEPLRNRLAAVPAAMTSTSSGDLAPFEFPVTAGEAGARLVAERAAAFRLAGLWNATAGTTAAISKSSWDIDVSMLDMMDTMANRTSGFDYWMEPEPIRWWTGLSVLALSIGPSCGSLRIENIRGSSKPAARIEYGTGRLNAKKYQLSKLGGDNLVTVAGVLSQASPTDPIASAQANTASMSAYGIRTQITLSDLTLPNLRQSLADEIIARRSNPRQVAAITPMPFSEGGNVPRPLVDYGLGDIIPAKVVDEGLTVLDGNVRVYGILVTPDENDVENVELELTPDTA